MRVDRPVCGVGGAHGMKVTDPFRLHRKDVTDWSIRRVHVEVPPPHPEEPLAWGPPGDHFQATGWDIKELSHKIVRARWGAGSYRVYFNGYDETGRRRPRGRTAVITLSPMPGDPPPAAPWPRIAVASADAAATRTPPTVVEALRAVGNHALATTIEQHLNTFGAFMLRRGM